MLMCPNMLQATQAMIDEEKFLRPNLENITDRFICALYSSYSGAYNSIGINCLNLKYFISFTSKLERYSNKQITIDGDRYFLIAGIVDYSGVLQPDNSVRYTDVGYFPIRVWIKDSEKITISNKCVFSGVIDFTLFEDLIPEFSKEYSLYDLDYYETAIKYRSLSCNNEFLSNKNINGGNYAIALQYDTSYSIRWNINTYMNITNTSYFNLGYLKNSSNYTKLEEFLHISPDDFFSGYNSPIYLVSIDTLGDAISYPSISVQTDRQSYASNISFKMNQTGLGNSSDWGSAFLNIGPLYCYCRNRYNKRAIFGLSSSYSDMYYFLDNTFEGQKMGLSLTSFEKGKKDIIIDLNKYYFVEDEDPAGYLKTWVCTKES